MSKFPLFAFSLFVCLVGAGFLAGPTSVSSAKGAAENYQEYCAGCHGEQLQSFVDRQWLYGNSWNEVRRSIREGIVEDGMPAYDTTFSSRELDALVDFILIGLEDKTRTDFRTEAVPGGIIEAEDLSFRLDTVIAGDPIEVPWAVAFLPDGGFLITDRGGSLWQLTAGGDLQEIKGVPEVRAQGQGGLLDVVLDPAFEENQTLYLSFSKFHPSDRGRSTTAVVRTRLANNRLTDQREIFSAEPYVNTRHHYGSRLAFGPDGMLYLSVGDRGRRDRHPQYLDNSCGKIHRIHPDGRIPVDNPFYGQEDAEASIFSYGHRNPQGLAFDPISGELWAHEHGPRGGDELNRITAGTNYGWPVISYGINYNGTRFTENTTRDGMEQPRTYWVPSIAPSGFTFVDGDTYPAWTGNALVGSLRFKYVARCVIENGEVVHQEKLLSNIGRVRDVRQGPDGYIYVAVEEPGALLRLVPLD